MNENLIPHIFFAVFFLVFFVLVVFYKAKKGSKINEKYKKFVQVEWKKVEVLEKNSPKHAVLEADKIFDNVLKQLGYQGGFVDKFKIAQKLVKNKEAVWSAHKLRNRIAHESGFEPNRKQNREALSAFRSGLSYLGIKV